MIDGKKIFCDICNERLYKSKGEHLKCSMCQKDLCLKHSYYYVDGCNIAITNNSKCFCKDCYNIKYNSKNKY